MKNRLENFDNSTNDLKTAEEIIRDFLGTQSKFTIRYLSEGSNNVVYLIEGESKMVVKLSKPDFEYKALSDYQKESWCVTKAHELNIPSPKVLKLGVYNFRTFLIESYVEGSPIAHLDESSIFSEEEKLKAWSKLGEYTKKINSVPVTGRGENLVGDGIFDGSRDRYVQYNIDSLNENDVLLSMKVFDQQTSQKIKKLFESLQKKHFTFGLCHSDIALRNAIMDSYGEVFLIDWGTARAEIVPHYEINEILRASKPNAETLKTLLDGYGISQDEFKEMEQDLKALNLLNKIDTLRWAIDKRPSAIQEHVSNTKLALEHLPNLL